MLEFNAQRKVLEFVGGERWDTALWMRERDDGGNLTVSVRIKICLRSIEMKTGPGTGWYQEEDDRFGTNALWERLEWEAWKQEYCEVIEQYWNNKFWIRTPLDYREFNYANIHPNIRCGLRVMMLPQPGGAHLTLNVVRLPFYRVLRAGTGGPGFTGWRADLSQGSDPDSEEKMLDLGEVAHILMLPHQYRQFANANRYYRLQQKVMGAGSLGFAGKAGTLDYASQSGRIHGYQKWMARMWQMAMEKHTGRKADDWEVDTAPLLPVFLTPDQMREAHSGGGKGAGKHGQ